MTIRHAKGQPWPQGTFVATCPYSRGGKLPYVAVLLWLLSCFLPEFTGCAVLGANWLHPFRGFFLSVRRLTSAFLSSDTSIPTADRRNYFRHRKSVVPPLAPNRARKVSFENPLPLVPHACAELFLGDKSPPFFPALGIHAFVVKPLVEICHGAGEYSPAHDAAGACVALAFVSIHLKTFVRLAFVWAHPDKLVMGAANQHQNRENGKSHILKHDAHRPAAKLKGWTV